MTRFAHHPPPAIAAPATAAHLGDVGRFLAQVARHPHQLGAICPTGPHLAAQAAALIRTQTRPQVVVELGPGGGAITDSLHAALPADSTLIAVEINTALVAHLRRTRPWLQVVRGDAADLPHLLAEITPAKVDLVISALPWSLITDDAQRRILTGVADVLAPDGTFATVVTAPVRPLPAIRRLRENLRDVFGAAPRRTRTVWRNVPPAHLLIAGHRHQPPQAAPSLLHMADRPFWTSAA